MVVVECGVLGCAQSQRAAGPCSLRMLLLLLLLGHPGRGTQPLQKAIHVAP